MNILVAEDDRTSALLLSGNLSRMGHEVTVEGNGRDAWDKFRENAFSVVITDWMMPEMDGLELCRSIRNLHRPDYTYILFLTSLVGKQNFLEGMEAGADDYLTKPVDLDELAARLRVAERILGLKQEVTRLEGLLPICSYCKKIRDEDDRWTNMESYIAHRSQASFTHSICPLCYETEIESGLKTIG